VILVDANILVYAHVSSFPLHRPARNWLDQQLNRSTRVGLPSMSLLAFLRLVTNPRVFEHPEPMVAAWEQVRAWSFHAKPPGHHNRPSGTRSCLAAFLGFQEFMETSYRMPISPRWQWSTD